MFAALARMVTGHPWRVIAVWVVASVAIVVFSPSISSVTNANQASFLPGHYQSVKAQEALTMDFPKQSGNTDLLVVERSDGAPLTAANQQAVSTFATGLTHAGISGVTGTFTSSALLSPNGKAQLVNVTLKGQPGEVPVNDAVKAIRAAIPKQLAGTGLTAGLTGGSAIALDTTNAFAKAENIIAIATVLLIVILLGLIFRSVLIAILPVVLIGLIHQVATSLVAALAHALNFDVGTLLGPLLIVVLFGIGTDYFVFLVFRYRENLTKGDDPLAALQHATEVVGEVISSSALTVIAAFAALLLSSLGLLRTLAPGLIISVALMLLSALTLVPAVLSLLGRHVFWPAHRSKPAGAESYSARIGKYVGRHPGRIVAGYGGVLLVLAIAAFGFRADYDEVGELPTTSPSVVAYNQMQRDFPAGYVGPTSVIITSNSATPLTSQSVTALSDKLKHTQGVAAVAPAQMNTAGTAALITVSLNVNPYSGQALADVGGPIRSAANGSIPGATVLVGGATSQSVDVRNAIDHDLSVIFPVAALIIAVILGLLLRAIIGPLYLLLGVGLGFLATLGILVLIFQKAGGLVGLDFSIPIVLYLFVVASGTVYNILMTARVREELRAGKEPAEAVGLAIAHGAPTVAAAGIILAGTFASLLLTGITTLTELGSGVAIGIIVAAFVMAPRLIPAMAGMRRWHFWWPGPLDHRTAEHTGHLRLHDRSRLERVGQTMTTVDGASEERTPTTDPVGAPENHPDD
ncbi:MAG: putative drug exporter of the superfamily [Acidimicrobiaceae bacterium]|nr:putative drug exporter of the superfamily [Acidimicrobiaceae bacterium]